MSTGKDSSKNNSGKKWLIIGYVLAAILAVAGFVLNANGNSSANTVIMAAFWIALFTVILGIELKKKQNEQHSARTGMINLPYAGSEYEGKDYRAVESLYKRLGFRNITTVSMHDLRTIMTSKPGGTEKVTIGGKMVGTNEWYDPDAEVVIMYHDFAE